MLANKFKTEINVSTNALTGSLPQLAKVWYLHEFFEVKEFQQNCILQQN